MNRSRPEVPQKLSCTDARRELAAGSQVAGSQAAGVAEHTADCADCAAFAQDAATLQRLAAQLPAPRASTSKARSPGERRARESARTGSHVAVFVVSMALIASIAGLAFVMVSREQRDTGPAESLAIAADARIDPDQRASSAQARHEVDLLAIFDRARSVWLAERNTSASSATSATSATDLGVSDPLALAWLGGSSQTSPDEGADLLGLALDGRLDTLFSSRREAATSRPRVGGGLR